MSRRTGFEIELLAPPGVDREVLADDLAARCGGRVRRTWVKGSEPSAVPGMGTFWHLAPGFEVRDGHDRLVATLVDDVTLVADLPRPTAPHPTWFRVLSDDPRLLRLAAAHVDPLAPVGEATKALAALFGTVPETFPAAVRVSDTAGATVALAAPLPGGRDRPCEIVTPPLEADHARALEALLAPARALGFTVPTEAAVHLHVDGAPFRSVAAFGDLVRLGSAWAPVLRAALRTNPGCTRLGPLPGALVDLVERPTGGPWSWPDLQRAARATGAVKFCDLNVTALLVDRPLRDTVEIRTLPGSDDGDHIAGMAALVHAVLGRCGAGDPLPPPGPALVRAGSAGALGAGEARDALLELAGVPA